MGLGTDRIPRRREPESDCKAEHATDYCDDPSNRYHGCARLAWEIVSALQGECPAAAPSSPAFQVVAMTRDRRECGGSLAVALDRVGVRYLQRRLITIASHPPAIRATIVRPGIRRPSRFSSDPTRIVAAPVATASAAVPASAWTIRARPSSRRWARLRALRPAARANAIARRARPPRGQKACRREATPPGDLTTTAG